MPSVRYRYLLNFAASYLGGGFKRLHEYANWFNQNGGAWFIIHPRCETLITEFPNVHFFSVGPSKFERLVNDCRYLKAIEREIGRPDLYYSYGIPLYARFGNINWFHLSNVLPLSSRGIPLPFCDRLKLGYLGWRITHNLNNADVISAESNTSLNLIDAQHADKLFLSVNGSDDEIVYMQSNCEDKKDDIATVVGTYQFKGLEDSYCVFEMLKQANSHLELMVIGNEKMVPRDLRRRKGVMIRGLLPRTDVIQCLRQTKYYISTTYTENSYNAASEGVCFADESYISDIGPHQELLTNVPFRRISIPNVNRPILHVKRTDMRRATLKTWDAVVTEMIGQVRIKLECLGGRD